MFIKSVRADIFFACLNLNIFSFVFIPSIHYQEKKDDNIDHLHEKSSLMFESQSMLVFYYPILTPLDLSTEVQIRLHNVTAESRV